MYRRHNTSIPRIPTPSSKENLDVEKLIHEGHLHDVRPEVVKPYENVSVPRFNQLYGTLRTENGWQWLVDNYANGTFTTIAATLVLTNVSLALTQQEIRLSRWPGAVNMYLCIRSFSVAPSTASFTTLGSLDLYYQDLLGGQIIPLGTIYNNDELNLNNVNILIPTPITDAGMLATNVGQIRATLSTGATVGNYTWQIAFSYAYLLPTMKPYEVQKVEELLDAHPGHIRKHFE